MALLEVCWPLTAHFGFRQEVMQEFLEYHDSLNKIVTLWFLIGEQGTARVILHVSTDVALRGNTTEFHPLTDEVMNWTITHLQLHSLAVQSYLTISPNKICSELLSAVLMTLSTWWRDRASSFTCYPTTCRTLKFPSVPTDVPLPDR
jgi:hypothetical protein